MIEIDKKSCFSFKKNISTTEQRAEHPFAGWNTQHLHDAIKKVTHVKMNKKQNFETNTPTELNLKRAFLRYEFLSCVMVSARHGGGGVICVSVWGAFCVSRRVQALLFLDVASEIYCF